MSSPLKLKKLIKHTDTDQWSVEVEFQTADDPKKEARFSRKLMANSNRFLEELLDHGAILPANKKEAIQLIESLNKEECPEIAEETHKGGWHGDDFVTARRTYGSGKQIKLDTNDVDAPQGLQKGTLKAYLEGIEPLAKSSRWVKVTMSTQCTSVVSGRLNRQVRAIFHKFGDSGEGKTLGVAIALAMSGRAFKEDIPNHAASIAGYERELEVNRHSIAVWDELGSIENDEKFIIRHLQKLAFAFETGHGRTLAADGFGRKTRTFRWNQLGLSTAEISGRETAKIAGVKIKPGFPRRFIDDPMQSEKNGAICDIKIDGKLLNADERDQAIKGAKNAITENYGVALPIFVNWILSQDDFAEQYDTVRERFRGNFENLGGWAGEFVEVYAATAAGGVMGVRAGVIPVTEDSIINSLVTVCRNAMAYAQADKIDLAGSLDKLKAAASKSGACPFLKKGEELDNAQLQECLGFKRKHDNRTILHISLTKLTRLLGGESTVYAFVKKCKADGLMRDAKTHQALMGGKELRYYRFYWFNLFPKKK